MTGVRLQIVRYGSAVLITALATAIRLLLDPVLGDADPFITFFFSVVLVAFLVGLGPSLTALALSCLSVAYFILQPRGSFGIHGVENQVGFGIFCATGLGVALLSGSLRAAQERAGRAEEAERSQRQELLVTLKSIGDAVIATDKEGHVTFINPVAESLTGWTLLEAGLKPLGTIFHVISEQSRQPIEDPVARVLREGAVVGLGNHTVLIARDGSEKPIEDSAAPIIQDNRVSGVVLVFRDATERRRLEKLQRELHSELERQVRERTAELKATEERFRLLVEGSRDYAIFMLDPQGHVTSWNPGAERIKGYRAEEIIGQHFSRFYPQENIERGKPDQELQVAAAKGKYEEEGWRLRKDGSRFWANVLITALRDELGNLRGFSKITRDRTEKKEAEEALRKSHAELENRVKERTADLARAVTELQEEIARRQQAEEKLAEEHERLRVTLASIGDAVIATDMNGRVVFLNPVAESLTGWKQNEAEGQPLDKIFPLLSEKTGQPIENPVAKVIREGIVVGLGNHTLLLSRDGTARPIADSGAPITDATGKMMGVVMVFRDVTEQRRAEWAVRESEARKSAILNTALDCIITMDHRGNVIEFNPAAEKTFGYNRSDVLGKPLAELMIPPSLREAHYRGLAHYLATGEGPVLNKRIEMPAIRADGSEFPVELSITRIPTGEPPIFTAHVRDISERKQLEHGLRQRVEQLADADRRKNEFLAILSHELRNPLAPIRNAVELLRLKRPDAELEWERDVIDRQAQHLSRLVDDLLDLSRISRGQIELHKERIPVSAIVHMALETSRLNIQANGHELTVTLPEEPLFVEGDLTRLAQVVANLLNNAAKYTPRSGHIWLSAERCEGDANAECGMPNAERAEVREDPGANAPRLAGPHVVLRIRDNGIGIPAEMLSNIFNMFTQVDTSLERKTGGLGIGLTLSRQLVELHGGSIEAHSAGLGQGSEFVARLPLARERRRQEPKDDSRPAGKIKQPARRILVVDDNKDAAESFAKLLQLAGHEVRVAHDGLEAIDFANAFRPNVVLLDIGLPKMNGFDAARHIREQPWGKDMMLVALTGWGQEEDRQRSKEAGFDHHLVKPVKAAALNELLAGVPSNAAGKS